MSSLQKNVLKSRLPPMAPTTRANKRSAMRKKDYTPVKWDQYFDEMHNVQVENDTFRVYTRGTEGPALVLLHGGGLSALGWSLFAVSITTLVKCKIVAVDQRGHGSTITKDELDLSAETLSADVVQVIQQLYKEEAPPVILMGHSMGGAIAVHAACQEKIPSLIGLIVIDVVEGTAMEALSSMQSFLRGRPKTFTSIENAVEWCIRSGQVRNVDSARVSMPGQIVNVETGDLAANQLDTYTPVGSSMDCTDSNPNQILEEENENSAQNPTFKPPTSSVVSAKYKWRIDLAKTETHWPGWFKGLSSLFLSCSVPKMLLLAGIDTLDRELTVGQMQGKFQMQVLPQCGHAVHEDVPDKVAEVLASFMVRFRFAEACEDFHSLVFACQTIYQTIFIDATSKNTYICGLLDLVQQGAVNVKPTQLTWQDLTSGSKAKEVMQRNNK